MSKHRLIILRHGEGQWNKENRFCSWVDQKLNSDGLEEARNCGRQLKALNFEFDLVFTSILNRSIHTAWLILEELGQEWVPVESSWRLNERHYGALIGLNREKMALNHGEEQVSQTRISSTSLCPLEFRFCWSWMRTCVPLSLTSSWATRRPSRQPLRKWMIKGK
ncbi:bisphosphoglycerate mutase isoform X2 [Rattus rattus]|uniref:bisphosphoglycerate mutase isoform X2 n=1 Tax=Rattus rattus TaxID=10117 RepID=UPI0013F3036B|nr:bisphosphoglycerate mutase isoform X2 [Rattus rattus]